MAGSPGVALRGLVGARCSGSSFRQSYPGDSPGVTSGSACTEGGIDVVPDLGVLPHRGSLSGDSSGGSPGGPPGL